MADGRMYKSIPRVEPGLIESLRNLGVADLHDALNVDWRALTLMRGSMRPLLQDAAIVGQAVTAYCPPGDNLMMHCALYFAQAGDVLVVSNGGVENGALWGENATIQAQKNGIAGIIADAPIRDSDATRRRGFPVWSTSISVSTPDKKKLGNVNTPINCGGVIVNPGDIIVADGDGVLVLPRSIAAQVAERARARVGRDDVMRAAIEAGGSIFETLKGEAILRELGATIEDGVWPGN